jgi:hypothetical protein
MKKQIRTREQFFAQTRELGRAYIAYGQAILAVEKISRRHGGEKSLVGTPSGRRWESALKRLNRADRALWGKR